MSVSLQERRQAVADELALLYKQLAAVNAKLAVGTNDPAIEVIWRNQQTALLAQIEAKTAEMDLLDQGVSAAQTWEAVERDVRKSWDDNAHEVNYDHGHPPMSGLIPILDGLNSLQGGAALFLVPEQTRMRSVSLLTRLRRWISETQRARYSTRTLTLDTLDEDEVIGLLLQQFGLPLEGTRTERITRLVDTLYASYPEKNTVVALEISIQLPRLTPDVFAAFMRWFLQHIWRPITERLNAQHVTFWRVVVFLMTDMRVAHCPPDMLVEPPTCVAEKAVLVRIHRWDEADLINWLAKYSRLDEFDYEPASLENLAAEAYLVGDGVPYPTWARLRDLLNAEIISIHTRIQNGELAHLSISG